MADTISWKPPATASISTPSEAPSSVCAGPSPRARAPRATPRGAASGPWSAPAVPRPGGRAQGAHGAWGLHPRDGRTPVGARQPPLTAHGRSPSRNASAPSNPARTPHAPARPLVDRLGERERARAAVGDDDRAGHAPRGVAVRHARRFQGVDRLDRRGARDRATLGAQRQPVVQEGRGRQRGQQRPRGQRQEQARRRVRGRAGRRSWRHRAGSCGSASSYVRTSPSVHAQRDPHAVPTRRAVRRHARQPPSAIPTLEDREGGDVLEPRLPRPWQRAVVQRRTAGAIDARQDLDRRGRRVAEVDRRPAPEPAIAATVAAQPSSAAPGAADRPRQQLRHGGRPRGGGRARVEDGAAPAALARPVLATSPRTNDPIARATRTSTSVKARRVTAPRSDRAAVAGSIAATTTWARRVSEAAAPTVATTAGTWTATSVKRHQHLDEGRSRGAASPQLPAHASERRDDHGRPPPRCSRRIGRVADAAAVAGSGEAVGGEREAAWRPRDADVAPAPQERFVRQAGASTTARARPASGPRRCDGPTPRPPRRGRPSRSMPPHRSRRTGPAAP